MAMADHQIVECVPNFSEGRNTEVIEAIAAAIRGVAGCSLLDVDAGASTNRTVYTFVGAPDAVVEGALAAARVAHKKIDMRQHKGEHPRLGALDVCPFVPVANVTMEECVRLSWRFGSCLATELGVPVFLYEAASESAHRKSLPQIRDGEYEGLEKKLKKPEWVPDFGLPEFVPSWGATVAGARKFLIAYNVNIIGTKEQAHRIALSIREQGKRTERGRLKGVKAIGWYIEERGIAQVLKVGVAGSDVVGLLPLSSILAVAEHYISQEQLLILHERQKVLLAVTRLGLGALGEFRPDEKIIEYRISSNKDGPLLASSLRRFVESVGERTSAPGGGSVAAAAASMGAALGTMVGLMTFGKKKFESLDSIMRRVIGPLHGNMQTILPLVDRDSEAFTDYVAATKLPQTTAEEKESRSKAMLEGMKKAVSVPLRVMRTSHDCWPHLLTLATHGNHTLLCDLQVAARTLDAGIHGAYYNVCINLPNISDGDFVRGVKSEAVTIKDESSVQCQTILEVIGRRLETEEQST